ncbi:MAG TPA: GIY-YIG nuclease family protein [Woeseiaceae bacterium]|nr:GIY-YIG nuclease family protein [Woeseiaceae bacterium]
MAAESEERSGGRRGAVSAPATGAVSWSVYVLRCADGSLYTGVATDVSRRLAEHAGGRRGAKYLRGRGPFELVLSLEAGGRGPALRLERRIKRLPRAAKERLLRSPAARRALLAGIGGAAPGPSGG